VDKYSIALLTKAMKQLKDKREKLNKIDKQITVLINDPHEMEANQRNSRMKFQIS